MAPSFSFYLHAHLPWVMGHGRWPHGEEWVCEAAAETYLPLIRALRRLREKGVHGGVTLSVSPVLAEQLASSAFRAIFRDWAGERLRTAAQNVRRFARDDRDRLCAAAEYWERFHRESLDQFNAMNGDLLGALRDLEETGSLELASCAATHGYLPLLGRDESIALQLELARRVHERHFGRAPRGLWLPELAYRPGSSWVPPTSAGQARDRIGLEEFVAAAGFQYFAVDSGLLVGGRSAGSYPDWFADRPDLRQEATADSDPHAPAQGEVRDTQRSYWVGREGDRPPQVSFVSRDPHTSLQVWSGRDGYPGDPAYLEFHKKSESGGHRYWRVTGPDTDLADKDVWSPSAARERVAGHAEHFRNLVADSLAGAKDDAILVAPYDAELFGHWWYEGVAWIEAALEKLHEDPRVELTTVGRHRENCTPESVVALPEGSWGEGGNHWAWRNSRVDWIWDLIHPAEDELWRLRAEAVASGNELALRLTRAMAAQLLVLSGSDWAFLVTTGSAPDYATERVRHHADDLARLATTAREVLLGKEVSAQDLRFVDKMERRERLFPELEEALLAATEPVLTDS